MLLDRLSRFSVSRFSGEVFRATRQGLDPLAASTRGGRWMPPGTTAVLYTSRAREGAQAEISFHWSQLDPPPSKPASLHRLRVATEKTLTLIEADLAELDVGPEMYRSVNYSRTQQIGAAVAFLECDGLIAPSARWQCENLMLFSENHGADNTLEVIESADFDWQAWARANKFLDSPG